jgi:hypothetical protein
MVTIHESNQVGVLSAKLGQEFVVRMRNRTGILFELSTLVSDQGVNVLAVNGAVCGEEFVVRLVTDDNRKTKDVLAENEFSPTEEKVVLVELPHRPAMLKQVSKTLAEKGIDIRHIHATASRDQEECLLVLRSSNDEEALARLRELKRE